MRQLGIARSESEAQRITAYLITQGIAALAEEEPPDSWSVWVRDENDVESARAAFELFSRDPQHERYRGVEAAAASIRQQERQRRQAIERNIVQVSQTWKQAALRRTPVTVGVVLVCVALFVLTGFSGQSGRRTATTLERALHFCEPAAWRSSGDPLVDIRKGQLWRLWTPVLLHGGLIHLLFNMWMFHRFASQIEVARGRLILSGLLLLLAFGSNLVQALMPEALGGTPMFVGMSGVVYGLFGYVWIKGTQDPAGGLFVDQGTVVILMTWLFLCMTGLVGEVANVAHVAGLACGVVLGLLPAVRS